MTTSPLRRLSKLVMAAAFRASPTNQGDWVMAMDTELDYIPSDWAALEFSVGCFFATQMENIRMQRYEPVLRWFLASCIFCWAIAKIYLLVRFSGAENTTPGFDAPGWLLLTLSGAALAYGSSAYFLFKRYFFRFGVALVLALGVNAAALGINALHYGSVGIQNIDNLSFYLALISEDYFIWTAILFGTGLIWAVKNADHVFRAVARS